MQKEESHTDLGSITIHKDVIASIASLAALEVEGVKRVGGNLQSWFMELMGRKSFSAIKVEINKSDEVYVSIPLVIKYGFNIPDVADKVQENIRNNLEKMTSVTVKEIDVNVWSIEKPKEKACMPAGREGA